MTGDLPKGRPGLVAITLDPRGGGIAMVSRLVERVLRERCGGCDTFTLARDPGEGAFETGGARRLAFGAEVLAAQASGRSAWLFFSHLGLAQVQRFVPAPFQRPYAVFLHDIEAWDPMTAARRKAMTGAFLRLANSEYTARRTMEANPGTGVVTACPLGIDALPPPAAPAVLARLPRDVRVVAIVGRMAAADRYKGHDQLIEAWPAIRATVPDATLVCAGSGDDVERLRAKSRDAGVGDAVVFTGFLSDAEKSALYARARVLAMPSRREGFGLVYLEAMSQRVPCVGSIHDAAGDVIDDGVTGFLVDQADRAAIVARIAALLTDETLRRGMGDAGWRRWQSQFTYDAFAARLLAHLREASARERSPLPAVGAGARQ